MVGVLVMVKTTYVNCEFHAWISNWWKIKFRKYQEQRMKKGIERFLKRITIYITKYNKNERVQGWMAQTDTFNLLLQPSFLL